MMAVEKSYCSLFEAWCFLQSWGLCYIVFLNVCCRSKPKGNGWVKKKKCVLVSISVLLDAQSSLLLVFVVVVSEERKGEKIHLGLVKISENRFPEC